MNQSSAVNIRSERIAKYSIPSSSRIGPFIQRIRRWSRTVLPVGLKVGKILSGYNHSAEGQNIGFSRKIDRHIMPSNLSSPKPSRGVSKRWVTQEISRPIAYYQKSTGKEACILCGRFSSACRIFPLFEEVEVCLFASEGQTKKTAQRQSSKPFFPRNWVWDY
jgi:hypothetical protein